ncbi:MAG: hypothetical protein H6812_10285 [Phycisphaeraceae bacterium]|nr:hypothetical protein [Phycisphaerales bacterium]MCB9843634.1 hypothetical protein [Phycisphaeraceae bacterium]
MAQHNLGPDRGPSLSDVAELADLLSEACRRLSEEARFADDPLPQQHDLIDVRPSALMGVDEGGRA